LRGHAWRGNVRELENAMHRAVLLCHDGIIVPDSLLLTGTSFGANGAGSVPLAPNGSEPARGPRRDTAENGPHGLVGKTVADVERGLIINTLQHCLGNRTHAANILGISIRTLRNKLKLYSQGGIAIPMPGESERFPA
jgi:DNA-binding NtrC family response regulator